MLTPVKFTYCLFFTLRNNLKKLFTREYFTFNIVSNLLNSKFLLNYLGDVKQRAILSRLGVETASNSFHLSVSLFSVLAGDFWSDLYGHD